MSTTTEKPAGTTEIRPFTIPVTPETELEALRARITATRWPDPELVADHSQGPKLAVMQELARYWGTDYEWRRCEARLSALSHFMTEIDGLDIHFIHVCSQHENALPPSSSTSTRPAAAATSPPGRSRRCSPASCAPRSGPCASGPNGR
jgi:hypothetical protein